MTSFEMEVREILEQYGYEEDTPIIRGSALGALNGVEKWVDSVMELMTLLILGLKSQSVRLTSHS